MRKLSILFFILAALLAKPLWAAAPEVGSKAPSFEAVATTGTVRLAEFLGKKHVVLAIYYRDFTPV